MHYFQYFFISFIFLTIFSYIFLYIINIFNEHQGVYMEKINNNIDKKQTNETLSLDNRSILKLTGIAEIISSSDTQISLKTGSSGAIITGQDIRITKLDISNGTLEAEGTFDSIKYGKSGNIFKRLFK